MEVLPRWRAVQKHLADSLKEFAPDYGALDAARVMCLPGTINIKSGMRAHFVHLDLDEHTDFEELARAVLPIDRSALRERRQARDANAAGRPAGSRCEAMARFVDTILVDVRRLIAHRWAGRIPKLHRNETPFVYGCFLVRRTGIVALPSALLDFGTSVCDLDDGEMEQIAGSIARKIAADRVGYRFSVAGAAERLGITAEEARLAGLVRLHPADPALEAERLNAQRARDRERKRQQRLSAGARPRELSLAKSKPWARHGISRSTWFRRRKTHDLLATSDGETVSSRPTDGGTPLSVGDGLLPRDR